MNTPPRHHAFTLLEMLLALSVLSVISTLVGTMWLQARGWSQEGVSTNEAMRLQRVCEFMRAQWADRRTVASLDEENRAVLATPSSLTFITATPILAPQWPMVIAEYSIEREPGSALGENETFRLIYSETPLSRLDKVSEDPEVPSRTLTLLAGVRALRLERYGTADTLPKSVTSDTAPQDEAAEPEMLRPDDRALRWRPFTRPDPRVIPAVRLLGEYRKEPLSCMFVVEALR